jgi:Leucine-rich repeat (LRR) protein
MASLKVRMFILWIYIMLPSVNALDLSYQYLVAVPESVRNTDVSELNLFRNELTELPDWIGELVNLKWLCLNDNELECLPIDIGNLVNLTSLNLERNQLEYPPIDIGNLVNLTSLNLQFNTFTTSCTTGGTRTLNLYSLTKTIEILDILNIIVFSDIH